MRKDYEERTSMRAAHIDLLRYENITKLFDQDEDGDTCLHVCIIHCKSQGAIQIVSQALIHGVHVTLIDIHNDLGQTALHLAVLQNMPQLVRYLMVLGANITARDKDGNTPLHKAVDKGHLACAIALTVPPEYNELRDIDIPSHVRLSYQVIPQDEELRNYSGLTCIHIAALKHKWDLLDYLIMSCNCNINLQEGHSGNTLLHLAITNQDLELFQRLFIKYGHLLDINKQRYDGRTAVNLSIVIQNQDFTHLLTQYGADINILPEAQTPSTPDKEFDFCVTFSQMHLYHYDDFKIAGVHVEH